MDPQTARRTWQTLEPVHGMIYFSPHAPPEYEALGLHGRQQYFASRAAAMGAVGGDVVVATFFNFNPVVVRAAVPACWAVASPERIVAARMRGVDRSLRAAMSGTAPGAGTASGAVDRATLETAAGLARRAAERAAERPEGKPLFAGHVSLDWPDPDEPHLVLWHAQTLLREYRGDIHVALLTAEGLSGIEALVTHAASGMVPAEVLRTTRAWSGEDWDGAIEALRARGIIDPGGEGFTPAGAEARARVETRTDELSAGPWATLGEDGCATLRRAARPLADAVLAQGWIPLRRPAPDG